MPSPINNWKQSFQLHKVQLEGSTGTHVAAERPAPAIRYRVVVAGSGSRRLAAAVLQILQLTQLGQRVMAEGFVQRRVPVLIRQI